MGDDKGRIRQIVSRHYADAVRAGSGCCGAGSGCCGDGTDAGRGFARQHDGYDGDRDGLPDDALANSFGCGNPLAFAGVAPGDVVLDLGCGAGVDLLVAAGRVGPSGRVIGVDMTAEMVDRARANVARVGAANVEVRLGIIEDLPVASGSVDWVISNCVINLSPEKDRVFAEIARVLRPGGRMRVSDIVVDELPDALRADMALYASCVAGAVSEAEYLDGLRRAGLVDAAVVARFPYGAQVLPDLGDIADRVVSARIVARKPGAAWEAEADGLRARAPRGVLFLCVANSARSQMAEGIARALAPAGTAVFSAGSEPGTLNPLAVAALAEIGIDIAHHRSKPIADVPADAVDAVITLCADEVCPAWLGRAHRLHWGLPDPAAATGGPDARLDAFREVRDELRRRLGRVFGAPREGG